MTAATAQRSITAAGWWPGKLTWSATPVTTARISDDVRPLFADGLGSKPSER